MQPLLEVRGVSLQYAGRKQRAVDNVSFSLGQGEILALLGPSGCGKTSLLRLIAGFETPQAGTIVVNGQVLSSPDRCVPPEERHIGIVFQDFALFPHLTVYQNVAFGLQRPQPAAVMQVLEQVRLQGFKDQYPHQLSGGQQQRVALARVLITNPVLVLLDEPLSNIDVQLRSSLRRELKEILQKSGQTAIWVTHDQEEAMAVADWIAVMQGGKLEQLDTPQTIYCHPKTPFVAQFVSQANLLPLPMPDTKTIVGLEALPPTANGRQLMILQEDVCLREDENSDCIITDRVFLGREWIYYVKLPSSQELIARITNRCDPLPVGTKVAIGGKWQVI
ncbi:MAG: ABC transporter ATP-binding protein [Pseudanabaenaceae cyanobacterium]